MKVQGDNSVAGLFAAALELDPARREEYLAQACGDDASLHAEVENLLKCASDAPDFLEQSFGVPPDGLELVDLGFAEPAAPDRIGKFEILNVLGAGGMGVVPGAVGIAPARGRALKVVRLAWASSEILRRFEYEAQLLALLKHAGIAQIYETGTAETGQGRQPYFAMELIEGPSLGEYARGTACTTRQKLELIALICDAVQHAHQRGIIHRDLKPANILVDVGGSPKILDFGVARLRGADRPEIGEGASMHTTAGQLLGTLAYMSPEQVAGDPAAIDARADVYAIGVMLYELLSGALPHDLGSLGLSDALRVIREQEPRRLSLVNPAMAGDLELIVSKATSKDVGVRYQSASELAGDIRRYLADQPVHARRPSLTYVTRKFVKRNRSLVIAAGIAVLGLLMAVLAMFWRAGVVASGLALASMLGGVVATLWQADRAKRAAGQATHEAARAGSEAIRASSAAAQAQKESDRANAEAARASEQASVAEAVSKHLAGLLESANPDVSKKKDVTLREMLDRSTPAALAADFSGSPRVLARLHGVIGRSYEALGELDHAEEHYRCEHDAASLRLGEGSHEMVEAINDLGHLYKLRDRFDESEAMLRRAVALSRQNLAAGDSLAIGCKINLASLLQRREAYAEAEELLRESTDAAMKTLGESHRTTHVSMNNLASAMKENGNFAGAIEMHRRFLHLTRETFGDANTGTIIAINNLAKDMLDAGDPAGAEPLFREALGLREALLGKGHRSTLNSRCNLATCLAARGMVTEASEMLRGVVEQAAATIERGNIERAKFDFEYGRVLVLQERYAEAEQWLLQSQAAFTAALGAESRKAGAVAGAIARLHESWNKPQDARTRGEAG